MRQSRREFAITAALDQIQLLLPDRAIEGRHFGHWLFDLTLVFLLRRHIAFCVCRTSMKRVSICAKKSLSARSLSFPDQYLGPSADRRLFCPIKTRLPPVSLTSISVTSSHPILWTLKGAV